MNQFTFEIALEKAQKYVEKYGKIVVAIEKNDNYWKFIADTKDGSTIFGDGDGSVFISKKDGREIFDNYPLSDFCVTFSKTSKKNMIIMRQVE